MAVILMVCSPQVPFSITEPQRFKAVQELRLQGFRFGVLRSVIEVECVGFVHLPRSKTIRRALITLIINDFPLL